MAIVSSCSGSVLSFGFCNGIFPELDPKELFLLGMIRRPFVKIAGGVDTLSIKSGLNQRNSRLCSMTGDIRKTYTNLELE